MTDVSIPKFDLPTNLLGSSITTVATIPHLPTSSRFIDKVAPIVNAEVAKYGDEFSWDWSFSVVPTPQGPQAIGLFMMTMKNPLIGTGDIAVVDPNPDLTLLSNAEAVADLVSRMILMLRESRAESLKPA
jgi:hypothetical protein